MIVFIKAHQRHPTIGFHFFDQVLMEPFFEKSLFFPLQHDHQVGPDIP